MVRKSDLPDPPEGKIIQIDDADLIGVSMTATGFELDLEENEWHYEDAPEGYTDAE